MHGGGKVVESRVRLPEPHGAQRAILLDGSRYRVVCCGRRFGKTVLGLMAVVEGMVRGWKCAWLAPSYRILSGTWREAVVRLRGVTERKVEQEHRLELVGGGTMDMYSMDSEVSPIGRAFHLVVIDEAALAGNLDVMWNEVMRPTLTDYRGRALFLSTPKGRNYFWQLWRRGVEGVPGWRSFRYGTLANPLIDPAEVAEARRELPERVYLQEYEAEFVEDEGVVFRNVMGCVVESPEVVSERFVYGVDWGKVNDYTAVVVMDPQSREMVALRRWGREEYRMQVERLVALAEEYPPLALVVEENAMGAPLVEELRRRRLPVWGRLTTAGTKEAMIERLILAMERGEVGILGDATLLNELLSFEVKRLPGGSVRYAAGGGSHDDCVMALALAWSGVEAVGEGPGMSVEAGRNPFRGRVGGGMAEIEIARVDGRLCFVDRSLYGGGEPSPLRFV